MPQKKHKPEEIVAKLRQVDVLVSQGQSVAETCSRGSGGNRVSGWNESLVPACRDAPRSFLREQVKLAAFRRLVHLRTLVSSSMVARWVPPH